MFLVFSPVHVLEQVGESWKKARGKREPRGVQIKLHRILGDQARWTNQLNTKSEDHNSIDH